MAILQNYGVLYGGVFYHRSLSYASKGSNEGVLNLAFLSNRCWPSDSAVFHLRSLPDLDPAHHLACGVNFTFYISLEEIIKDNPIGFQKVILFTGIKPPTIQDITLDVPTRIDKPLNGVGDLQLATPGGLDMSNGFMNSRGE